MPRELIVYELISDTDDSNGEDYLSSEESSDVDNKAIIDNYNQYNTVTVGDDENVWQENNRISIVIILLKYLSC